MALLPVCMTSLDLDAGERSPCVLRRRSHFLKIFAPLGSIFFKTLFFSPKMTIACLLRKSDYCAVLVPSHRCYCCFSSPLRLSPLTMTRTVGKN